MTINIKNQKNNLINQKNLFDEAMNEINKNKGQKNIVNAENINRILDKHFMKLELIKFNMFGEDFENYGNIVVEGQTYYPHKLNLDYLVNQINDMAQEDSNVNLEILNSLKNAEKAKNNNEIMKRNTSMIEIPKKFGLNTNYKKIFKNRSCENMDPKGKTMKLPRIQNKLNITSTNFKFFLQRNCFETNTRQNRRNFLMKKNNFLKRYGEAKKITKKLNKLEHSMKNIENQIINDCKTNEEKIPQFRYRYKYLQSKFIS